MIERFLLLAQTATEDASATALWSSVTPYWSLVFGVVVGGVGIWLMLPPRGRRSWIAGAIIASVGLALLIHHLGRHGGLGRQVMFWSIASVTVGGAVATISMRSPVYSAIWFAMTLLGTAGLFLLHGAQFLSVATVIVYAGAILVTFLFVLMLAQPEGHTHFDRISWGPFVPLFATACGVLLVGGLGYVVANLKASGSPKASSLLHEDHMAMLGAQLFSRHLLSVEIAGTLLLVALVGAIAIVIQTQGKQKE